MKVRNIQLGDDGLPEEVTVTMNRDEAILIAKHTGQVTPTTETSHSIWGALTCDLFNRFWEDGVDGAQRGDPG